MPLDPKDGIGSYIKDFKKSKAPQFKGKSEKKRRDMAIAAYLDAKRGPQEAKLMGNTLKLFGQMNRSVKDLSMRKKVKPGVDQEKKKLNIVKPALAKEDTSFKVSIDGLPDLYMNDKTSGALLQKLRKIVKQPSLIKDIDRTTKNKVKKAYRDKAQGREVKEYKYDYGTPESVKLMKKVTPGEKEEGYVSMAQQRAVWATRKDGGKGHPDNKKRKKK